MGNPPQGIVSILGKTIESTEITDLTITDADVSTTANIGKGKISSTGTWANAEIANLPTLGTLPSPPRQTTITNTELAGSIELSKLVTPPETNATTDQTGAEIKTAYEGEANAYTDTKDTKLSGIETSATADQTGAEIKTVYESEADTNAFTDAEQSKLTGIVGGAKTGDVVGPASSTDNALIRFDGVTGKLVQNSNAILADGGALTVPTIQFDNIGVGSDPIFLSSSPTNELVLVGDLFINQSLRVAQTINFDKITIPADPPIEEGRSYVKQIDANNNGLFIKIKKAGVITEVQLT